MATIERDNRILLEKMSFVMRTRGRVDNRNDYEHKSLNKTKRQRELLRVTHENQVIFNQPSGDIKNLKKMWNFVMSCFSFSGHFKADIF